MNTPVIFFAFSNDPDAHLALLKEESRSLFKALEDLDHREYIKIYREESANLTDLFEAFTRYKDRIAIFHYGGHAEGTLLRLEEGEGRADGLAQLMGEQSSLKLVFLNGCSSKGQVETLFNKGVKAVIATTVPIEDRMAMKFALRFYDALANKRTIIQAYQLAEAFLKSSPGAQHLFSNYSGLTDWDAPEDSSSDDIPWGLYIHPDHKEDILDWKLPYFRPVGLPNDMIQFIGKEFSANKFIVLVLDEMCKYNPDIYDQMVEKRDDEIIKKDSREYPWLVIKNFPWPIGSQIRLLRLYDKPNRERVEHLVSTYIINSYVLYSILLSDLWEIERKNEHQNKWEYINFDKEQFVAFDYIDKIVPLYERIREVDTPFVPEFEMIVEDLINEKSPLNQAYLYLEKIRKQLDDGFNGADLEKMCITVEQALSIVLRSSSFLSRYRLLTVRNVGIDKSRFEPITYELDMGPLNATQGTGLNLYQDANYRRKGNFSDSNSIVLVSNEDRLDRSLNLSPMIIDKNTYVQMKKSETTEQDKLAHIFLLGWTEGSKVYYISVDHSFFNALNHEADQIHTDMTLEDFTEGRNIPEKEEESLVVDFGFDFGVEETETKTDDQKVFQILKDQHDMLIADLNPVAHA